MGQPLDTATMVMGHVGWFVIGFPIMLMFAPLTADPNPSVGWAFPGPGVAVAATVLAPIGQVARGRLCLLNGLVSSLGQPLAIIVFPVLLGHHAWQAGGKMGMIASGMLGIASFFFGRDFPGAFTVLRTHRVPYRHGRALRR